MSKTVSLEEIVDPPSMPKSPSKLKENYAFIILLIIGIGALAAGGAGVAGYLHAGALSNMHQINAIVLMTVGGGIGAILSIIGTIGIVKNCPHVQEEGLTPKYKSVVSNSKTIGESEQNTGMTKRVFGVDDWAQLGIKVMDKNVPLLPKHFPNQIVVFIPQFVEYKGFVKNITEPDGMSPLLSLIAGNLGYRFAFSDSISLQRAIETLYCATGWVVIDKDITVGPINHVFQFQTIEKKGPGSYVPNLMELFVASLMSWHFNKELLWEGKPVVCVESFAGYPISIQFKSDTQEFLFGYGEPSQERTACGACAYRSEK